MKMNSFMKATSAALILVVMLLAGATALAQSGRGGMRGYVDFQDVAYNDLPSKHLRAKVELRGIGVYNKSVYTTQTDEHGIWRFDEIGLGEYELLITAPGYREYKIEILIPSDFIGNLAIVLKKTSSKAAARRKH
jgi:hypothetical protein